MALPAGRVSVLGVGHPGAAVPAALGVRREVEGGDERFAGAHPASLPRASGGARGRGWRRRRAECSAAPPKRAPSVAARLTKRWPSCSQVKPMPPKDWIDSRQTRRWQSSLAALAMETAVGPVRRVLVDGGDGEVAEGAGPLDGEEHVAHLVLDGLEGADGDAELLAVLDVGQHQLEERVAGADGLEREPDASPPGGHGRSRAWRPRSRARRGRGRRGRGRGRAWRWRGVGSHRASAPAARPASAAGTTKAPMPSPARAMTTTSVVPASARTPSLVPLRTQPPSAALGGHGDVVERPGPRVVGQRHGPGDGAGGDLRRGTAAAARGCRPRGPSGRTG